MESQDLIRHYSDFLLDYNKKVNLISRQISKDELNQLINESLLVSQYISNKNIIDAGSGNGILGIPLAILNNKWKIALIEPRLKKVQFLNEVINEFNISNVNVFGVSIEEYVNKLDKKSNKSTTIVARGFPKLETFSKLIKKLLINEAVIITSENKIKKNEKPLESIKKNIYNVPLREHLKILKITN